MDNPYLLKNNPDYLENLKMLPEDERKRLLEGDWDAQAGMFFTEWSPSRHVVDDFDVPEDWQLILGWDDGTREPRAVNLYAIDNDQKVWCVWEYYRAEENLDEAAKNIRKELKEKGFWGRIYKCVVDPSMKRTDSQTGISSIEVLEDMGFGFHIGEVELGNNNRVEGWRVMKTYLSHKPYEEPLLKFFRSCENIIRTIPDLMYYQPRSGASSKKEDLDTTQEDHSADACRYVLMSLDRLPSRFGSASSFEVKRREYKPKSSFK
jgi:phage terminase large subunit